MLSLLKFSKRQIFRATSYASVIITSVLWNTTAAFADQVTDAIGNINLANGTGPVVNSNSQGLNDFTKYIKSGFNSFYTVSGIIVFACFILAGVLLAASRGNPKLRVGGFVALGMAILGAIVIGGASIWYGAFYKFGQAGS